MQTTNKVITLEMQMIKIVHLYSKRFNIRKLSTN